MSTSEQFCNDGVTTKSLSSDDGICEVIGKLQNLSTSDKGDMNVLSVCENCGKEGGTNMNTCNKCKMVKYCNAACKKKHRSKHKKKCEEYVRQAEERAAMLYDIELFKQPPQPYGAEDCPICFLRLPYLNTGTCYMSCCGKVICSGCGYAPTYDNQGNEVEEYKCPFCRTPSPQTKKELIRREKKRVEMNDAIATGKQGNYYQDGTFGFPQDYKKAFELLHRAGELGNAVSYCNIGYAYYHGEGVEKDEKKARYYYELSAIRGFVTARHNLGYNEERAGNMDRALKHYMIAARDGYDWSLKRIKCLYSNGHASKDDFTTALQSYQLYLSEIKSVQRDKVAAIDKEYRYY